jgi:pyruvate/2-oxoglutarate dehydrogenase complex dihydrolipoamide acyltransferase (E2) component
LRDLGTQGKLSQNELFGGTITLSNIGTIGGTYTGKRTIIIMF